jgi:capsular exopolysaccharide synthesis family protein
VRTAILVLAAIIAATLLVTPKYKAAASLYVRMEQAPVDPLSQDSGRSSRLGSVSPLAVLNSYVETLESRTTAERVVRDLELDKLPPPNALRDRIKRALTGAVFGLLSRVTRTMAGGVEDAPKDRFRETVDDLQDLVSAEIDQDTELILITVLYPDRQLAQAICQKMADILVFRATRMTRTDAASAHEIVAAALPTAASRLSAADRALSEFKRKEGIVTLSDEQRRQIEQLGNLEMQHLQAKAALEEIEARLTTVRQSLAGHGDPVTLTTILTESPEVRQIQSDLYQREQQLAALLSTHTEEHPEVIRLKSQIDAAQKRLAGEVKRVAISETQGLSPEYETLAKSLVLLEGDRMGVRAREEAVARLIRDSRAQLARLPAKEQRLQELVREQQVASKSYLQLVERADQLQLASQMSGPPIAITVIDPPRLPKGIGDIGSPPYLAIVVLGPILSVMIGLTMAFVTEYFDNTLGTQEEVADRLDLPVLASNPSGDATFTRLRDEIWVRCDGSFPKVLLVASARQGEGRTSVVAGLARALADAMPNEAVLAVDADLRSPNLHGSFGADASPGLSDVLAGRSDLDAAVRSTDRDNIALLPAGEASDNACMLVASEAMRQLLPDLKGRAAVILLDSPPIGSGPEVQALAGMADRALLVVRADRTDRDEAQNAAESLAAVDGNRVMGVVLNDVRFG